MRPAALGLDAFAVRSHRLVRREILLVLFLLGLGLRAPANRNRSRAYALARAATARKTNSDGRKSSAIRLMVAFGGGTVGGLIAAASAGAMKVRMNELSTLTKAQPRANPTPSVRRSLPIREAT
jgi:hypothetical protein